jgi:hypothetical protein
VVGAIIFFAVVAVVTLIAWTRHHLSGQKADAKSRQIQKYMDQLFAFAIGIAVGIVGVGGLHGKAKSLVPREGQIEFPQSNSSDTGTSPLPQMPAPQPPQQ